MLDKIIEKDTESVSHNYLSCFVWTLWNLVHHTSQFLLVANSKVEPIAMCCPIIQISLRWRHISDDWSIYHSLMIKLKREKKNYWAIISYADIISLFEKIISPYFPWFLSFSKGHNTYKEKTCPIVCFQW